MFFHLFLYVKFFFVILSIRRLFCEAFLMLSIIIGINVKHKHSKIKSTPLLVNRKNNSK